ncbi:MAG: class II aldolase/adducin family protein [Xenococcaceae cyanobacterium MO_167.B27]|nr:class II aldolase/adducin family protein [Xenococcaceae cyanobacterium MO_167.B27]
MIDEGYIKYQCYWTNQPSVSSEEVKQLNFWRERLYKLGLIGIYPNGVGFGNISIRHNNTIIISGTQTGVISNLTAQHYTRVTDFDWEKNTVTCVGEVQASSETLTHGAIYTADPEVNGVIHVHHLPLWQKLMDKVTTTNRNCAYGTPEMAREIIRLCQETEVKNQQIIVMSGHKEGIITFGKDLEEAGKILLDFYAEYKILG